MSTDQEIMRITNEFIRVLPQELKSKIDEEYSEKGKKLIAYLTEETDMEEKKIVLSNIVREHQRIVDNCVKAMRELLKIYKRKDVSNIAGVDIHFTYKNPDPEGLLKKKKAGETFNIYRDIATLIKTIMDKGQGNIDDYIPKLDETPESWSNSFKYWQIFAALVNAMLSETVDLTVLKSIDGLDKYNFEPFKGIKPPGQQKQKTKTTTKGRSPRKAW